MTVIETDRLTLRRHSPDDAEFILRLLNEPSWLRFIGDRGVRTLDDARAYILKGPVEMHTRLGFGLYVVELREGRIPIGVCGLIKRDYLDDVDVGFGFLPPYWGKGYGYESAAAVLEYARRVAGLKRVVAITSLDNHDSVKLLEKLGLQYQGIIEVPYDDQGVKLFAIDLEHGAPRLHLATNDA